MPTALSSGIAYQQRHAAILERLLDAMLADTDPVTLHPSDDVYLCSYNHARLKLGIPLPPPGH